MVTIPSLFGANTSGYSLPGPAALKQYVLGENKQIQQYVKLPQYKQAVDYFKSHIGKITSVDQLVKDPRLLGFVLTAFSLDADAKYPAKVKAVLNSDLTNQSSFANRSIDPRYKQMAQAFNFNLLGTTRLKDPSFIQDIVNKYTTNAYETSLSDINPSLRSAAYFLRNIGNVTDTYQILGDGVLRAVVTTALGLPPEIVNQDVSKQKALIDAKLDIKKFANSQTSSSSSTPQSALTIAQKEQSDLVNLRNVIGAAEAAVQTIQERIEDLQNSYQQLATTQDAVSGPYAAEIPYQENAAPTLVEQQGLLAAAQGASGTINDDMAQLQKIVQQAGDPSNTTPLSDLQAQFTTLYNEINSKIAGATYVNPTTGATENLLDGSTAAITSPQYDSAGDQVSVRSYDLSSGSTFGSQLTAAFNAFTAGTPDLSAAANALSTAKGVSDITSQTISVDQTKLDTVVNSVTWAGTYDTAQLYRGSQSVYDANLRIVTINQLLGQIQNVAQQSSALDPAADRSALQQQYSDLLTKLNTAIGTAGSGADNLLNSAAVQSYTIDTGATAAARVRGSDLVTNVQNVLSGMDVSSVSTANAVIAAINGSIHDAIAQTSSQLAVDGKAINIAATRLDPRSAVDNIYRQLAADIPESIKNADWLGSNLLDATQKALSVTSSSAGTVITINPESTFDADVTQVLNAGVAALPSDPADSTGAIAQLNNAAFNVNRILDNLMNELHQVDFAKAMNDSQVKALQEKAAQAPATGTPLSANAFAIQFIQKYMAQVDLKNSGTQSATSPYLALFQNVASSFSIKA